MHKHQCVSLRHKWCKHISLINSLLLLVHQEHQLHLVHLDLPVCAKHQTQNVTQYYVLVDLLFIVTYRISRGSHHTRGANITRCACSTLRAYTCQKSVNASLTMEMFMILTISPSLPGPPVGPGGPGSPCMFVWSVIQLILLLCIRA